MSYTPPSRAQLLAAAAQAAEAKRLGELEIQRRAREEAQRALELERQKLREQAVQFLTQHYVLSGPGAGSFERNDYVKWVDIPFRSEFEMHDFQRAVNEVLVPERLRAEFERRDRQPWTRTVGGNEYGYDEWQPAPGEKCVFRVRAMAEP